MSKRRDRVKQYAEAIVRAGNGDKAAEQFLRAGLKRNADTMPVSVLLTVSEALFGCRLEQLREEAQMYHSQIVSRRTVGQSLTEPQEESLDRLLTRTIHHR